MLQCDEPGDFVIATGETHSVRELVETAFGRLGLDPSKHVRTDPRFLRPTELEHLVGDASKAREKLGWRPQHHLRAAHRPDGRLRPRALGASESPARGPAEALAAGAQLPCVINPRAKARSSRSSTNA